MRNLQKILALVLALIMSFSLVATAGAFSDDGDISDAYKDAVTVLNGLEVFKGYDNGATFQPKGNITRAEVAAIIYRIATGDVTDSQASIYTSYNQFTDVLDGSWYSGYVNYCANAGYIKGRGNKIFDPQSSVTGYEALAMILRAVGYDKNGEFTGSNWQIRTASIANEKEITKNVTSAQLGQAATREMVAEILFRSIVIPKVNFNANTLSYTEEPNKDGKVQSLGYESLKLEEIEGVVTANEYADLEADEPLSANRTRMDVNGTDYTLEYKSDLDYLGESRIAYVQNLTGSKIVNNVLLLGDTGDNVVYDEGKSIKTADAASEKSIKLRDDTTLYFVNYDPIDEYRADWRIEYVYTWTTNTYSAVERVRNNGGTLRNLDTNTTVNIKNVDLDDLKDLNRTELHKFEYTKTIAVGDFLTPTDINLIDDIFSTADYEGDYILGEVYVGTSSIKKTDDISDDISYREFVNTYLTLADNKDVVDENTRGNRLKVIDNNNDGVVEYVLQTKYTVTTVSELKSDGSFVLETKNDPLDAKDVVNEIDNDTKFVKEDNSADLALNDVVLYAVIDGNARTEKAEMVNAKIDKVNRTNGEVTTTDGTTYEDSDICAHAEHYNDDPKQMAGSTNYNLYLDKYGYLAAFNEAEESFVLLVDGWYNRVKGGDEYAVKTWQDGKLQTVDVTANGDLFIGEGSSLNNDWDQIRVLDSTNGRLNNANRTDVRNDVHTSVAMLSSDGVLTPVDMAYHTLKQSYIIDMADNKLPDRDGKSGQIFTTRANATDRTAYNVAGDDNVDVRALSSTVYYFVYNALSGNRTITQVVREYVGYQNLPNTDYENYIEDVYAVGTTQTSSVNNRYYTAEVVVVELNDGYYNTLGGEQVFIPRFPIVGTNVTLEEVELVRENGALETVTIDLSRSDLRYYDIANGTNTSSRTVAHGLYRMWRVSDSDTYYVRYMSAQEIADADRYYVGMVDYNTGTGARNYTVLDLYGRDVDDAHARAIPGAQASALNLDSTKYYTYADDELTASNRDTVMIQTPTADIRRTDTCVEWQNETQTNGGYQRNEVLVAYDKADNGEERIAYAISFNEYDSWDGPANHVHDAAQSVWSNCTPYHNFGGVTPTPTYDITVNYVVDGAAATTVAPDGVTVTGATTDLVNGNYTLTLAVDGTKFTVNAGSELQIGENTVTIADDDVTVTVKLTTAAPAPYVLTFDAALKEGTFDVTVNGKLVADGAGLRAGDIIGLNPAAALDITGADATGSAGTYEVTGDVTVSSKDGFTYSNVFEMWMGTNAAGDLITVPYDPTIAAADMRARAASDDAADWAIGKVDTTVKGWFGKVVRDYGATYTIEVDDVVWTGKITAGGTTWKLTKGTAAQAKAAVANIDKAVVTKTEMAPVEPVDEGTVSVSVGKLTGSGANMVIKSVKDGITSWVSSTRLPIVDGVVTVEVRYTETAHGTNVPVVAGEQSAKFVESGATTTNYTAQIPAQDGDEIELVDAAATTAYDVTLTPSTGVTILGAETNGTKAVELANTTGKAVFTVTVPAGAEPRVTNLMTNRSAYTGAKVTQTKINGDTWKIVIDVETALSADLTGNIIVLPTAPIVTVTEADAARVKLPVNPTTGTATGGTFTFAVYVLQGDEPVFQNLGGATYEASPVGGDFQGNMQKWTVVLNNVNGDLNVSVDGVPYQTLKITGVGERENLILKSGEEGGVRVSNGKAEFTVYLKPGATALAKVTDQKSGNGGVVNVKITSVASIQHGDEMWGGWRFELSGIDTTLITSGFDVKRGIGDQETIRVFAPVESGITPREQIIYTNEDGDRTDPDAKVAVFTVKTSGDTVPFIENAEFSNIWVMPAGVSAGNGKDVPRMAITKTDTVNEWKIELRGATIKSGDIHLCAKYMPVVNTAISGSGVSLVSNNNVPATVIRDSTGKEWYTQTFTYAKTNNARLEVVNVLVNGAPATTNKTNIVETADGYRVTVMVERGMPTGSSYTTATSLGNNDIGKVNGTVALTNAVASAKPVNITLQVKGVTGYKVTLTEDSRFSIISDGGRNVQYVSSGDAANFTIKLNGNYSVERGNGYEVSTHTGTGGIVVTVPNITADKTITLDIRDISSQDSVYYEGVSYGNIRNMDNNTTLFGTADGGEVTSTPNWIGTKDGYLVNGEGSWRIGAEMGYVPRVIATYANGSKDVTDECIGIHYIRTERFRHSSGTWDRRTVWEVTVKATESVHLDFDLTPAITSTENNTFGFGQGKGGQARGLDMQIYTGVTVGASGTNQIEKDYDVDYMGVNLNNVTPVTTIYDTDKKTIPFYVLVQKDCEIVEAGIVGNGTIGVDVTEGAGYSLSVPDGYRAVLVTVNLPIGQTGTYSGDVELRAIYNN